MSLEVSVKRFRETVEAIEDPDLRIKMKTGYLLAARNSEVCTKVVPWDLLHNASKPYGIFMKYNLADFKLSPTDLEGMRMGLKEPIQEKALVITVAVAKRGKRLKKKKEPEDDKTTTQISPQEIETTLLSFKLTKLVERWKKGETQIDPLLIKVLQGKVVVKAVAIPCNTGFENWTLDLLKEIKEHGKLSMDFTRKTFWAYYRKALSPILPPKSSHSLKNPLRHFRISHLINYYNFSPYETTSYTGWSIRGTFMQMGQANVSANIDAYAHLAWRSYFPKLLQPLTFMK